MRIDSVDSRHRNDFTWTGVCEGPSCGHVSKWGDGYADRYYCTVVVPNRPCPACDLSTVELVSRLGITVRGGY